MGSFQALWKSRMHVYHLVLLTGSWDTLDTVEWEMTKWDESPRLNLDISQPSASYAVRPNPKFWHPKIWHYIALELLILGEDFLDETTFRSDLIWHLRQKEESASLGPAYHSCLIIISYWWNHLLSSWGFPLKTSFASLWFFCVQDVFNRAYFKSEQFAFSVNKRSTKKVAFFRNIS